MFFFCFVMLDFSDLLSIKTSGSSATTAPRAKLDFHGLRIGGNLARGSFKFSRFFFIERNRKNFKLDPQKI